MLLWLFQRALLGLCIFSLIQFFLSLAIVFRLLPHSLRAFRFALRGLTILSFRLYRLVLRRLAPFMNQWLGVDIVVGVPRVLACIALSVILGTTFVLVVGRGITGWMVTLFLVHGLLVGLTWDEIEAPGGIQLGVRIE